MQIPVTGWIGGLLLGVGSAAATPPPVDSVEAVQKDLRLAYEDGLLAEEAKELIDRCFDLAATHPEAKEKVGALSLVLSMTSNIGTTEMTEIFREAAGTLVEKFANSPAVLNIGCGLSDGLSSCSPVARRTASIVRLRCWSNSPISAAVSPNSPACGHPSSRLNRFSNPSGSAGRSVTPSRASACRSVRIRCPISHAAQLALGVGRWSISWGWRSSTKR